MSDLTERTTHIASSGQKEVWEKAYRQEHPLWRGPSNIRLSNLKGRVLELGCGDGKTAISMLESRLKVVGLDLSRTALLTFRRRKASEDLSLVQGDALALPFKEGSFDSVAAIHIIDHFVLSDRLKLVQEINRVLSPGGVIIGRFFSTEDMRFGNGRMIEPNTFLRENGIFNHYFTEKEIVDLFSGYNVTSIFSSKKTTKFSGMMKYRSFIDVELEKVK